MKARSLLAAFSVTLTLGATRCGTSPTEPVSTPATGSLIIRLTQPCSLPGSVAAYAGNTYLGTLVMPGDNTFSVPAGSYSLSFVRGQDTFAAAGQPLVQVPAGGVVVATDPPGACVATSVPGAP